MDLMSEGPEQLCSHCYARSDWKDLCSVRGSWGVHASEPTGLGSEAHFLWLQGGCPGKCRLCGRREMRLP